MSTMYVVTAELAHKPTEAVTDWIVEYLADWHAVAHAHESGNVAATLTLPAEGLPQAVSTAVRVIEPAHRVVSVEAVDEATRDRREGWVPIPDLVGVTRAAEKLNISRAAVHKRIASGALPAQQVGREWAIPADSVK